MFLAHPDCCGTGGAWRLSGTPTPPPHRHPSRARLATARLRYVAEHHDTPESAADQATVRECHTTTADCRCQASKSHPLRRARCGDPVHV